jgi:anthranilate/para-aminobenzoate synthase component II
MSEQVLYGCCVLIAGAPADSGICLQAVRELGPDFPLFGVCMGHQCIGEAFGGAQHARQRS